MRVTTWNVNGLRAAIRKGFTEQLDAIAPDVLLLQEIRVLPEQLAAEWRKPDGWYVDWNPAEKKGYAGTAIWSREPIESLTTGFGNGDSDLEGRLIRAKVNDLEFASAYLPSGSSSPERQTAKEAWMAKFREWADSLGTQPFLFGGDLNIAHTERDIFHAIDYWFSQRSVASIESADVNDAKRPICETHTINGNTCQFIKDAPVEMLA